MLFRSFARGVVYGCRLTGFCERMGLVSKEFLTLDRFEDCDFVWVFIWPFISESPIKAKNYSGFHSPFCWFPKGKKTCFA